MLSNRDSLWASAVQESLAKRGLHAGNMKCNSHTHNGMCNLSFVFIYTLCVTKI